MQAVLPLPRSLRAPGSSLVTWASSSATPASPVPAAAGPTRTVQLTPVPLTAERFKPFGQVRGRPMQHAQITALITALMAILALLKVRP